VEDAATSPADALVSSSLVAALAGGEAEEVGINSIPSVETGCLELLPPPAPPLAAVKTLPTAAASDEGPGASCSSSWKLTRHSDE